MRWRVGVVPCPAQVWRLSGLRTGPRPLRTPLTLPPATMARAESVPLSVADVSSTPRSCRLRPPRVPARAPLVGAPRPRAPQRLVPGEEPWDEEHRRADRLRRASLGHPPQRRLLRPRTRPARGQARAHRPRDRPPHRVDRTQPRCPLRQGTGPPPARARLPGDLAGRRARHPLRHQRAHEGCGGRRRRRAPAHHRPGDPQRLPDRHLWLPLHARLRRPLPRERAADLDLLARRRGLVGGVPRPLRALRRDHRQLRGGWPSTARPTARSPRRSRAPAPQWKAPRRPLPSRPATLCGVGYIATGSATSSGWSAISGP